MTNLDYSDYVGRIAVGKVVNGVLKQGTPIVLLKNQASAGQSVLRQLYTYRGLDRIDCKTVEAGDIAAVAGVEDVFIGDTLSDPENPRPLPSISVEEPTMSAEFSVNSSPLAGQDGRLLTSRQIKARLEKEILYNVSIRVEQGDSADTFNVSARGELQLAVLVETMRREGFELSLSNPRIITKKIDGVLSEPLELAVIDVPEEYVGVTTEKMSARRGKMKKMINHGTGRVRMEFEIPTRGMIGYRSQFLTDTRGSGILTALVIGHTPYAGRITSAGPTGPSCPTVWARRWPMRFFISSPGAAFSYLREIRSTPE